MGPSGESTYTRRQEIHTAKEGSVSGAALGLQKIPLCRESRAKGSSWAAGFRAGVPGGGCYLCLSLGWEWEIRAPSPGVRKPQPVRPLAVRPSELTSWAMPEAAGRAPCSAGRLSLGELQPDTGVLLLLGEESAQGIEMGVMGTST